MAARRARGRGLARNRIGGIPLEEAPLWMVAVVAVLHGGILFLATVGFLAGAGLWRGQWQAALIFGGVAGATLVFAISRLEPWRRPTPKDPDTRPALVRFATWLFATAVAAFVLEGILALILMDNPPGPAELLYLSLVIAFARWLARLGGKRRTPDRPPEESQ